MTDSRTLGSARAIVEIDFTQLESASSQMRVIAQNVRDMQAMLRQGNDEIRASAQAMAAAVNLASRAAKGKRGGKTSSGAAPSDQITEETAQVEQLAQGFGKAREEAESVDQMVMLIRDHLQQIAEIQFKKDVAEFKLVESGFAAVEREAAAKLREAQRLVNEIERDLNKTLQQQQMAKQERRMPTFLQFGLYPFAGMAQTMGMTGLAGGLMGGANAIGMADAFLPMIEGLPVLRKNLIAVGGVIGNTAQMASNLAGKAGFGAVGQSIAALLPLTAAAVGAGIVFQVLKNHIEELQKAGQEWAQSAIEISKMIGGGTTTADIQDRIDTLEAEQRALNEVAGTVATIVRATEDTAQQGGYQQRVNAALGEISELTDGMITTWLGAVAAADLAEQATADYAAETGNLALALNSSEVAANDAAAAMEAFLDKTNNAIQERMDAELELMNMSREAAAERVQSMELELALALQHQDEFTGEAADQNDQRIQSLMRLIPMYDAMADREMNVAELAAEATSLFVEIGEAMVQAAQMYRDYDEEIARQTEERMLADQRGAEDRELQNERQLRDFIDNEQDINTDYERNRLDAIDNFNQSLADYDADYADKVADLKADSYEKDEDSLKEHQDRLAKILSDSRISIMESAARLDARAVFEAIRQRNEALREESKKYDEEKIQRQEELTEKLDQLAENYAEERAQRVEDFNERLNEQAQQFERERIARLNDFNQRLRDQAQDEATRRRREAEDRQIADTYRWQDFQRQLAQLNTFHTNIMTRTANFSTVVTGMWTDMYDSLIDMTAAASVLTTPVNPGVFTPGVNPDQYALGTPYVPSTDMYMLHKGEAVLDPAAAQDWRSNNGGVNINVGDIVLGDIGNYSEAQIRSMIRDGLRSGILDEGLNQFYSQSIAMHGGTR